MKHPDNEFQARRPLYWGFQLIVFFLLVKRQFPIYCRLWRQMLIIGFSLTALILGQIAKEFLQAAKSEEI